MKRYKINYESVPHGVISWRHDGADAVYCEAGVEVRITWQPSAGWGLSEAHYTDAQGNEVAINTKEMAFTMPESDITIGGTFKRFVVTDWEGYEGGGGGGTTDYNGLDNKPSINGVTLQGNKTGKELKLDDVKYVSTFEGVTGDVDVLYFLDTEYDTYKVGFYRFIEAQGTEPAKFVGISSSSVKYVSTFTGVVGNTEELYYLDTAYDNYEVGFYRFVEATTTEPEKFVILNKQRFKYVSTFTGEVGDTNRLYYLDTAYDDFKKGFYRYNGTAFVNINPKEFFYVSTFNGVEGDDEALYFLDTNYDEYTIGFYRYVEVEEAGVTVGKFIHTGNPHQLQVTYAKLKEMRDNSMLIPGMNYRITDYQCTTTQADTRSANHPFDIIVTADSANTLNENAYAALHEGDTYFANNDLSAWKLKYCLDNDTSRFAWADATNGKGVVYYMKDEFHNECPYDFKNIMFKRKVNLDNGFPALDLTGGVDTWCYTFTATKYDIASDTWSEIVDGSLESPHGHMSEEGFGTYHHNIIKEYIEVYNDDEDRSKAGLAYLSNNVFLGYFEYNGGDGDYQYAYCSDSNTLGINCRGNTFWYNFQRNTIGNGCSSNTFGSEGHGNTFGNYCSDNTFGNGCTYNTFGSSCSDNTFGNYCSDNTFGSSCSRNAFGNGCTYNTCKNLCSRNAFGNECSSNTFGNNCQNNTFGNECSSNTFGSSCSRNTFGNNCQNNTFGNGCTYNTFGNYCSRNTFGVNCTYNTCKNLCSNNTFGNNFSRNAFGNECTRNAFGNECTRNAFGNYFQGNNVFSGVVWCRVTGGTEASPIKNAQILSGVGGKSSTEIQVITFAANKDYTQYAAKTTAGKLRIWNIADEYEESNIIDVTVLPTANIDTDALYRLTTTHYYHNGTELADAPQGYKSLNEEALVADENGLTAIEGETSTTTPWAEVTDAMIATLVSGSLVAACEYGEAGFFKTDADEYDYAGNFSTADTYTLWHNATGEPTDWVEVDSVSSLVTDGETTEDVDGELRANAIVDVTALPTTGIKAKTIYRMLVDRYFEDGTELTDTPSGYLSIRPAIVIIDENGITDNGTHYAWADITDDKMDFWIIRRQISQVYAADLMTMSTCFRTAANHYVYKDHVTEEGVYELYHNPTATANAYIKIGGEGGSAEVDDVTTEEVNGKVQANAVIEVNSLPTTDIKTKSLYRRMETIYKHDGVEVPNVTIYKVRLNDTIEATPEGMRYKPSGPVVAWDAANIGSVIQQAITDEHVETTTWDDAEFFAFGDGEYDYENHFSRILPGSLWQNRTGAAAGWEEVGGEQAVDEVTIVEEHGILKAMAVIDVTQLPSAGMKGNSLYRKVETVMVPGMHIYTTYYHGGNDPVPEPVECYKPARAGVEFRSNEIYIDGVEHSYEELKAYRADWVASGYIEACDFLDIDTTTNDGGVGYPNEGSYQFLNRDKYTYNTDPVPVVMNKIFQYTPSGEWESISTVELTNAAYNLLDYEQKMDGTTYIVED